MSSASKVALVTGAGSGVGRASALALHAAGYHVVLAGRRLDKLEETAAMAGKGGGEMMPVATDVTRPDEVDRLLDATVNRFGRLDVLFNNAGTFAGGGPIETVALDDWMNAVAVNQTGVFLVAQAAFRIMKAQEPQGGRIINNGSLSAHVPRPHSAPYAATKHAVSGLTKIIAIEGRDVNVACAQIDIGNAASDMTHTMNTGMLQADGRVLPEPTIDATLVADAVVFIAGLPLEANVPTMTLMATKMPYLGRG